MLGMALGDLLLASPVVDAQPYLSVSPPLSMMSIFVGDGIDWFAFLPVGGVEEEEVVLDDLAVFFRLDAEDDGVRRRFLVCSWGGDDAIAELLFAIVQRRKLVP